MQIFCRVTIPGAHIIGRLLSISPLFGSVPIWKLPTSATTTGACRVATVQAPQPQTRTRSSWTSTSHVDVGTEQKMFFLKLRRWWLHDYRWRRRAWHLGPEHGRLHMTIRGNGVPAFSVPMERRAVAFAAVRQLRQSGKRFVAGTDAHRHQAGTVDQDAERLAQSRMCREMAHHCPSRVSGIPST